MTRDELVEKIAPSLVKFFDTEGHVKFADYLCRQLAEAAVDALGLTQEKGYRLMKGPPLIPQMDEEIPRTRWVTAWDEVGA